MPPDVLFNSSCKIFALLSFFLCSSLNFSINFSFVVGNSFTGSNTFLLSNKNFSGWRTSVVSFTFLVWPEGVSLAEDFPEMVFYFDGDFLWELIFDVLNFELWLRLDLRVLPWFEPLILTVRPKSGISKFLSCNWANSKFVNRFSIFAFS